MEQSQYTDKLIKENMNGVVIKYLNEKQYGFIRSEDKAIKDDIFVYFNQIVPTNKEQKEFLKLHQYQQVTFDLYMSKRGLIAKNVKTGEILVDLLMKKVSDE